MGGGGNSISQKGIITQQQLFFLWGRRATNGYPQGLGGLLIHIEIYFILYVCVGHVLPRHTYYEFLKVVKGQPGFASPSEDVSYFPAE